MPAIWNKVWDEIKKPVVDVSRKVSDQAYKTYNNVKDGIIDEMPTRVEKVYEHVKNPFEEVGILVEKALSEKINDLKADFTAEALKKIQANRDEIAKPIIQQFVAEIKNGKHKDLTNSLIQQAFDAKQGELGESLLQKFAQEIKNGKHKDLTQSLIQQALGVKNGNKTSDPLMFIKSEVTAEVLKTIDAKKDELGKSFIQQFVGEIQSGKHKDLTQSLIKQALGEGGSNKPDDQSSDQSLGNLVSLFTKPVKQSTTKSFGSTELGVLIGAIVILILALSFVVYYFFYKKKQVQPKKRILVRRSVNLNSERPVLSKADPSKFIN